MKPIFWKVSQSPRFFSYAEFLQSLSDHLVYVHKDTLAKAGASRSQGEDFVTASIGDYFYMTHGNHGIYVLGQFTGPVNLFSLKGRGWLDRPYRPLRFSQDRKTYGGPKKRWAPNENSTFIQVPETDLGMFEKQVLSPYFDLRLKNFQVVGDG